MKLLAAILSGIMAVSAASTTAEKDSRKEISTVINAVEYTILVNSDGKTAELKSAYLPYSYAETDVPAEIEGYKITSIGERAYAGNFIVEKITIGQNIKSIGEKAFMSCYELKEVELNEKITAIPDDCFFSCPKLETVVLPDTLKSIGDDAFYGCVAYDAVIPSGVTSIGTNAIGMTAETHGEGSVAIPGFIIRGATGTAADKYAKENGIEFIDVKKINIGDVNGDETVNSTDASAVLEEYGIVSTGAAFTFTKKQRIYGDVNFDGAVDSSDASCILEIYAKNSTGG
ncbi:MAG: leucine-rich repeat protein [Ruminococcus sp.]|nr:leucine-rich repeat protein [Ruminococcus sp.]